MSFAYLSASALVRERVDVQVGDAQQTVVAPTHVAGHGRHGVQRAVRSDRVGAHQRGMRPVLVAAAAVQRGPLHFGDEQRLHQSAGPVQTVERSELGLMAAEQLVGHRSAAANAVAASAAATATATAAIAVIVAAAYAAPVVRHRHAAVTAASVQVAEGRRRAPA